MAEWMSVQIDDEEEVPVALAQGDGKGFDPPF